MRKYAPFLITLLRILIGWYFLYEGISKLLNTGWSAKMYLMGSKWILSDFFHRFFSLLFLRNFILVQTGG